jgi:undecaprenyl-diphosphatase
LLDPLLTTILLGLIQGIAEWLPISSTAHLKLAEMFLGLTTTPLFNLVLHLGTLFVLVFYFRREVKSILIALWHWEFKSESGMLIPRIVVATIPAGIVGLTYALFLADSLGTLPIIAATFIVGATIVYTTKYAKENVEVLSYKTVLLMGLAEGFAIFPGLSRSGVTISVALLLGLKREKAFKFSFLLSIPAILGDFAVEVYNQRGVLSTTGMGAVEVLAGVVVTVVAGYLSLRLLSRIVRGKKFHYFAFYTWALGILLLLWVLLFG